MRWVRARARVKADGDALEALHVRHLLMGQLAWVAPLLFWLRYASSRVQVTPSLDAMAVLQLPNGAQLATQMCDSQDSACARR